MYKVSKHDACNGKVQSQGRTNKLLDKHVSQMRVVFKNVWDTGHDLTFVDFRK